VVYRLITCGSVEEKIYRRQVFKGGLSRAGTCHEEQLRYFSYVVRPWPLIECKLETLFSSPHWATTPARGAAPLLFLRGAKSASQRNQDECTLKYRNLNTKHVGDEEQLC